MTLSLTLHPFSAQYFWRRTFSQSTLAFPPTTSPPRPVLDDLRRSHQPEFLGEIFRYCKEDLGLESTSVVTNGSKVTEKWMQKYGRYLDMMALSCDSFDPEILMKIGRSDSGKATHIPNVLKVTRIALNSFLSEELKKWECVQL
jgi:hypothetical protein